MEARDAAPRDAAWDRVTEQFSALGERVRQRYEEQEGEVAATGDSLQDALRTLGDAAERLATTVGDVIRDPGIQDEARRATSALVDAVGLTFSRLGQDLRRPRMGSDDAWDEDTPPPPGPPASLEGGDPRS